MQSFKIFVTFCALIPLTGCAMRSYRPQPVSPALTAASLETRSLADSGLRDFIRRVQPAPTTWPVPEWGIAYLTLAAFYFNPTLEVARKRVSEAEAAVIT